MLTTVVRLLLVARVGVGVGGGLLPDIKGKRFPNEEGAIPNWVDGLPD